jgi:fructose-bisphosphate aldolase class 1
MDGDFSIEVAEAMTERVIAACYQALSDRDVLLEGSLLKPNMVRSGSDAKVQASAQEIAHATVRVLQRTTPPFVAGITFLSGGGIACTERNQQGTRCTTMEAHLLIRPRHSTVVPQGMEGSRREHPRRPGSASRES